MQSCTKRNWWNSLLKNESSYFLSVHSHILCCGMSMKQVHSISQLTVSAIGSCSLKKLIRQKKIIT